VRALLILHGVLGLAATGALTHHAIWCARERKRPGLRAQSRRYARLAALLAIAQLALAGALHPASPLSAQVVGAAAAARLASTPTLVSVKTAAGLGACVLALSAFAAYAIPTAGGLRRASGYVAATFAWLATVLGLWLGA
jgi:hypothetical protein